MVTQFKIFEKKDKGEEVIYTLKNKATSQGKTKTYEYDVNIIKGKMRDGYGGLVLSIEGTPGSWYVEQLLEGEGVGHRDAVCIDGGTDWYCHNWKNIIQELSEIIHELVSAENYNL